jgi:hypothetical protein
MKNTRTRNGLGLIAIFFFSVTAQAIMPSNPSSDPNFSLLPNGKYLNQISVSGQALKLTKGVGVSFSTSKNASYQKLKSDSMSYPRHKVQWVLRDLDNNRVIAQSASPDRKIFGASSSKIFVGGALLDKQDGLLNASQLQLMANMLVVSSNDAWRTLQTQIGNGDTNRGREGVHNFTQGLGYELTRGYQGYWGNTHGNELTAMETTEFLHDIYKGNFPGAETLWKLMYTCRTGVNRGLKYMPSSLFVGGKTGTYDGETENPETGSTQNPDGSAYTVNIRNHILIFNVQGRQYGLAILADTGSDESAALLAGGLLREYTGYQARVSFSAEQ